MFYSQRNNTEPFTYECEMKFWNSFLAHICRLFSQEYLYKSFGYFNENENRYETSEYEMSREMTFKLGFEVNPFISVSRKNALPSTDEQLDTIEFFYIYISKPIDSDYDTYYKCSYPIEFDSGKAHYDYTVEVNDLFKRNRLAYKMKDGKIERVHSGVLDNRLKPDDIQERLLREEATQAVRLFKSRNPANMKTALTTMANAYERAKGLLYKDDKQKSIKAIIKQTTSDNEKLDEIMNSYFTYLTNISNNCDIRHKETNKIELKNESLQEYLFYSYYNAIRYIVDEVENRIPF